MLKKQIEYTDYEGQKRTATLYFHLTKFEWLELEAYTGGGLVRNLQTAIEKDDAKKTIDILKKIILRAYGEKNSETGEFEKSDEIAIKFSKTIMFSELFYELAYDEAKSQEFFMGLIPPELQEDAKKKMAIQKAASEAQNSTVSVAPSNQ